MSTSKTAAQRDPVTTRPGRPDRSPARGTLWLFGLWAFLASVLVFWVELMVAKMLLPAFGGSPSVWNTALVFFQINLLAGYAAAHLLARLPGRTHKVVQTILMAAPLLTLPVVVPAFTQGTSLTPTVAVLASLVVMIGAPFFALTTSAPTLQHWFAKSSHPRSGDPYFLYALSNLGSVVGLFGYPLVLERITDLDQQSTWWTFGYALVVVLTILAAKFVGKWDAIPRRTVQPVEWRLRLRWASVAFVPSLALLGVTRHLSTDVAAFPLMWTLPLAIYLASFTATFRDRGDVWRRIGETLLRPVVIAAVLTALVTLPLWVDVGIPLMFLAALSLAAHGRIFSDRPKAEALTDFYLWVSVGGAVGGLFGALAAPSLVDFILEYPLALVLAAYLVARPMLEAQNKRLAGLSGLILVVASMLTDGAASAALLGVGAIFAYVWLDRRWLVAFVAAIAALTYLLPSSNVVAAERTFFGVYRVHDAGAFSYIMSGSTLHGVQVLEDGQPIAASYYTEAGPIGDVFEALPESRRDVGVVGLGIGNLIVYGREGDVMTFYEIDPAVERLARDHFAMFATGRSDLDVLIGDGRLELERIRPSHDLLVVDAFASDAIPVHLLTLEAFQTYLDSVPPDGAVLVHVTNRHLDLEPIVGRIARELDVEARIHRYVPAAGDGEWATRSVWMILEPGSKLDLPPDWVAPRVGTSLWTDSYSDVVSAIRWR